MPLYSTVIVWGATLRDEEEKTALPVAFKATGEPRSIPPSLNWTAPAGIPAPGATAETVAVKVTGSPDTVEVSDEVTAVVVEA